MTLARDLQIQQKIFLCEVDIDTNFVDDLLEFLWVAEHKDFTFAQPAKDNKVLIPFLSDFISKVNDYTGVHINIVFRNFHFKHHLTSIFFICTI